MICVRPKHLALAMWLLVLSNAYALGQGVGVTAHFALGHTTAQSHKSAPLSEIVIWLSPLQTSTRPSAEPPSHPSPFRLIQKNKQFIPHVLVVPTGASVEFPNRDPFFHNVFSLFNGKRFDLGLYESGTSRSVRFDREGVSYIFCNIHPEMGAVVLALNTPYYAISDGDGIAVIHDVPPGSYSIHLWSETYEPTDEEALHRVLQVGTAPVTLGNIELAPQTPSLPLHKNKFGEDYRLWQEKEY